MTTGSIAAGREMVPLLIVLTGLVAVLAGPLFREGSSAWAQLDSSRPQSAFRLVGTIEGGPFTGAVIDDTKNPHAFYRLNEKLPDESRIVKVRSDHIVLKWPDGTRTELYTTPGERGAASRAPQPRAAAAPQSGEEAVRPAPVRSEHPGVGAAFEERRARIEQRIGDQKARPDTQKDPKQGSNRKRGRSSGADKGN